MRRGGRFEPSLGGGGGGSISVPMFVQVSLVRENTMTFLKFGIISNHLAHSFSSDLIPHLHGSGWGWGGGGWADFSYTFDVHSKVEHRGFHASDSYDSLDLPHSKIQSTVLNNVHLCSQLSWCTEIMHGQ